MSRALLFLVSALVWAVALGFVLTSGTPARVEHVQAAAKQRLRAAGPKVALAAESLERGLLDDARELALGLGIGAALERPGGEAKPAKKGRRAAAAPPAEVVPPLEQLAEQLKDAEEAIKEVVGTKRWVNVFDKRGRVVSSVGADAYKTGATMKNAADVASALEGVSQIVVGSGGKGRTLVAFAPTIGNNGAVNGAVAVGMAIDSAFCASVAGRAAVPQLALFDGQAPLCSTVGFELATPPAGEMVRPGPLDAGSLLFVDASAVGVLVSRDDQKVPVLGATIVLADDLRPGFAEIASWQQGTIVTIAGLLAVVWLLLGAALFVAAKPADAIANHLALIHQGGKVPSLSERKFSGSFKRIVKNLNTLLEKREQKSGGPSLQPISALLAGSPDPAEQDMRFETADTGTIGQKKPTTVPPPNVSLASEPPPPPPEATKPLTLSPMVEPSDPAGASRGKKPESKPSLSPLSPATFDFPPAKKEPPPPPPTSLNTLFDDKTPLLDEDKTMVSRAPSPSNDALPPLPAFGQDLPKPNPVSTGIKNVSPAEADGALGNLNTMPSGNMPADTPWDPPGSTKGGISPQDEEHYHQVFEEFLKVRAQCGEPTNNLTFDKFIEKLKKSRDQVMQKQNTKVVRFQVYVKDGKAALKAVAAK